MQDYSLGVLHLQEGMLGKNHTGDTQIYCKSCQERSVPHPLTSILKERRQNNTCPCGRKGGDGGGGKQRASSHEAITGDEQTVTVRVWPFSVGACPIVIFLRNLSLVSSTTVGREGKERLLRKGTEIKERRSGQWQCSLASGRS